MSTPTQLSTAEYLRTTYSPDRDYVNGELEERNSGEFDHAAVQAALVRWFSQHRKDWSIRVLPEVRVKVSSTRYRIPDICILSRDLPIEQIVTLPPIACIEILSPDDSLHQMAERIADYQKMGVGNVWIIDPAAREGYDCRPGGLFKSSEFRVDGSAINLRLTELFEDLD